VGHQIDTIKKELVDNPNDYKDMTNKEIADSIQDARYEKDRSRISGEELSSCFDKEEYLARTDQQRSDLIELTRSEFLNPFGFSDIVMRSIFAADSKTVTAFEALRTENRSRGQVLKLKLKVREGHIEMAKAKIKKEEAS